jgi:hypothetical protein
MMQIANVGTDRLPETADGLIDGEAELVDEPSDYEVAKEVGSVFRYEDDEKVVFIAIELSAAEKSSLTPELRVDVAVREGEGARLEEVEVRVVELGIRPMRKVEDHRNTFDDRNASPKIDDLTGSNAGNGARDERAPRNLRIDLHQLYGPRFSYACEN